jgi:hypothetical protein
LATEPSRSILKRSSQANIDLVDLSEYFAFPGVNLAKLPQGLQILSQAPFDVRGIIQLKGKSEINKYFKGYIS